MTIDGFPGSILERLGAARRPVITLGAMVVLTLAGAGASAETYVITQGRELHQPGGTPNWQIPDASVTGLPVQFVIEGVPGTIRDIDFSIDGAGPCPQDTAPDIDSDESRNAGVTHSWTGDLIFTLTSPSGTTVNLINRPLNGQDGYNFCTTYLDDEATESIQVQRAPFTGYFKPNEALSAFDGQSAEGVWTLRAVDPNPQDSGYLNQFTLYIETDPAVPANAAPVIAFNQPARDGLFFQSPLTFAGSAYDFDGSLTQVEYRVDGGTWILAENQSGDWTGWTFPAPIGTEGTAVEVRATDNEGRVSTVVSRMVALDPAFNPPPVLSVTQPAQDVTIANTTQEYTFRGEASDENGSVTQIFWSREARDADGQLVDVDNRMPVDSITNENGYVTFEFTYGDDAGETFADENRFEFVAQDNQGAESAPVARSVFRNRDSVPPNVTIVEPPSDVIVSQTTTDYDFEGTAFDPDSPIELVEYRVLHETLFETIYTGESRRVRRILQDWADANNDSGDWTSWSFTAEDLKEGDNLVEVRAEDEAGIQSAVPFRTITLSENDLNLPTVSIDSPQDGTQVSALTETIEVFGTADAGSDQLEIVLWRVNGSSFRAAVPGNINDYTGWSFEAPLDAGVDNLIEVKARDVTSQESAIESITVIRPEDNRMPPIATITDPDRDIEVPNSTAVYPMAGVASDGDGVETIVRVEHRVGPNLVDLSDWTPVTQGAENWGTWTLNLPLDVPTTVVEIRAVDNTGYEGPVVRRIFRRTPAEPQVTIIFPEAGYVAFNYEESLTVRGSAIDQDGSVQVVRYRAREGEGSLDGRPWVNATDDSGNWSAFSFDMPLAVGTNSFQVQAIDNDGADSDVISGEVTRLKGGEPYDLITLTEFTDVWGAENEAGEIQPPLRFAFIGFRHDIPEDWKAFSGDFNGDNLTDVATITQYGDLWLAYNNGAYGLEPPFRSSWGWAQDDDTDRSAFAGDFDGDGRTDMVQIVGTGQLILSLNNNGILPDPGDAGTTSLRYRPASGLNLFAADINGDGLDDLLQLDNETGELSAAMATGTGFAEVVLLGEISMRHDPAERYGVHFGDFNADGLADVCEVHDMDARVLLNPGIGNPDVEFEAEPADWGRLGFHDDPSRGKGWWVFTADIDGDGLDDLIQLNEFGEIWLATSNGRTGFRPPEKVAALGFGHKPEGKWQVFPARVR